ncbi:AP-5 complex subunit zeta-1-like [Uloborus diversus]|uniref:AP-5 complex subunit zeta-1-like n=1 Tax=Uloborus diversus TaxID=327109 RepID=UPI002409B871|nr:AP-5 complex subunit zeta-1-like [Uloborus diversus]
MWFEEKKNKGEKSLKEIVEDAPKTLSKEYLQTLNSALFYNILEPDIDIEPIISSLLLIIIDENSHISLRHSAVVVLQKLSPIKNLAEILTPSFGEILLNALPVLLKQNLEDEGVKDLIKKLTWEFCNGSWTADQARIFSPFLTKVIQDLNSPLMQDDLRKVSSVLSSSLIIPSTTSATKASGFRKSTSSLSITEIDGTDAQDFFTILNYASTINAQQFLSIQVFSMLKSFFFNSSDSNSKALKKPHSFVGGFASEDLSLVVREYCLRVIDQVDRKGQSPSVAEFQKACLVETIDLFNTICLMDPGIVHTIFPVVRRIYDQVQSNIGWEPVAQDVAILTSAMQFIINHGSSIMHKPDNLYVYLFCDLLSQCYKDNYVAFEILYLMKQNLSQLCYHSSVLEKYFPTFLKVLAWRPNTFLEDFIELLPAFMSQQTSLEVFHMLLDLPCLTAILMLIDSKSSGLDSRITKDPTLLEAMKTPELSTAVKYMIRRISGMSDSCKNVNVLHQNLSVLASNHRVLCCAKAVIPLLKQYFEVLMQYADMSTAVLLVPCILERLTVIYPVPRFDKEVQSVLAESIVKIFELHPETVFHNQKCILNYLSHFKNYFTAEKFFIHMVWIVGEYVSNAYSSVCRPEIIAMFFEILESTVYEALSYVQESSNNLFLKFLSVSSTTLAKLAARNQDQVPRAALCLSKVHQQLSSFGNQYKKEWKIVIERVMELISILNSPSVAAIVLSPPKDLENGRLHRDPTALPYILRTITGIVTADS